MPLDDMAELSGNDDEAWTQIARAEQKRLLEDGFKSLPPRYRLFIELHFYRGLTLAEVASAMQLSIDNAYTIKHRAIQKLKARVAVAKNGMH